MIRPIHLFRMLLVASVLLTSASHADVAQSSYQEEVRRGTEEIYVFRTVRTQHQSGATPACAAAPFTSANQDHYDLWSIALRAADSRVVNTHKSAVGGFTACLSKVLPNQPVEMYATGSVAQIPWIGVGECAVQKAQPPVRTVVAFSCTLALGGLPDTYAEGLAVSSTLAPFLPGNQEPSSHVPGYLSTSVVTIRLWKKVKENR